MTATTVTFTSTVDGGANSLAVAGIASFGGAVTNMTTLSVSGTSTISANITTTSTQAYTGAVTLGASTTLTTTNSAVTFSSTVNGTTAGMQSLTIAQGSGAVTFSSTVGATVALNSLSVNGSGAITLNGNVTTYTLSATTYTAYTVAANAVGNQAYGGSLGMDFDVISTITISQLGVFDSGSNGLSSPINVRIYNRNTQAVVASLAFAAGQSGTLINGSRFMALATPLTLSAGFQGVIEADGYNASELNGNTISQVTNTGGGAISFVGSSRYGSAGQYPGSLDASVAQYLAGTFQYVVGTSVSTGTGGTQSYSGPVTLAAATTLTTTDSAVTFGSTVDGAQALTVSTGSGAITFTGVVGGTTALGALTLNSTGVTTFSAAVTAASVTTNAGGSTAINGATITTTGAQTYNDAVTLGAGTTLTTTDSAVRAASRSTTCSTTRRPQSISPLTPTRWVPKR